MLQVAFDSSNDAMVIVDGGQRVRWANQQAANLWSGGLAILLPGKRLGDILRLKIKTGDEEISPTDLTHPLQKINQGSGSKRFLVLHYLREKQQDWKPCQISWKNVEEVAGGFALLTFRDIEPAEKALEAQQYFLNQLAHELYTPLAIINGSLKRLERENMAAKALEQTEMMRQEAHRISRLLEQMSVLSQLDTDSYPWNFETRTLSSFLLKWAQRLDRTVRSRISLNLDDLDPGLQITLDQSALIRVLDHLLDNSLMYAKEESPILLSAKASDDEVELRFMDWGPGIPETDHGTIFARFKKLEHMRSASKCDGAGLGLAVVRELIEGMKGRVNLLANRGFDGKQHSGTVIQIQLTLAQEIPPESSSAAELDANTADALENERIES